MRRGCVLTVTEEFPLSGGATANGVVRVGETVRKPPHRNSQLVRDVLLHLERAGFDAAPRWLGVDEQGRDVLSWIDGETFTERGRMHPYIGDPADRVTFSDEQLAGAMRLLRRYHDTFVDGVICHGDFGPWNIVWREGMPVAVIDFDNVYAGDAADDVAYALRMFVGYGFAAGEPGGAGPADARGADGLRRRLRRVRHPRARVRPRRGALHQKRLAPAAREAADRAGVAGGEPLPVRERTPGPSLATPREPS